MAKKKVTIPGSQIGYGATVSEGDVKPKLWDNNPDGVLDLPSDSTDPSKGYTHHNMSGTERLSFTAMIANGESREDGDVNVNTADGIASSKGQGSNQQYNFDNGTGNIWNKNREWSGGNRTGE